MRDRLVSFARQYGFWVLLVIHFFGVIMMSYVDLDLFASFTPLNLLLSALLLFLASAQTEWKALFYFFSASFLIGFGAEVLGTQTGFPFGEYWYLPKLGPQRIGVPLIIGVNWFLLAYSSALWAAKWFSNLWIRVLVAAALMVGLDFFIEPLCETLGFWAWRAKVAPWENYLGWYGVSIVVQAIFVSLKIKNDNPLARGYLMLVALFFIMLNILL